MQSLPHGTPVQPNVLDHSKTIHKADKTIGRKIGVRTKMPPRSKSLKMTKINPPGIACKTESPIHPAATTTAEDALSISIKSSG